MYVSSYRICLVGEKIMRPPDGNIYNGTDWCTSNVNGVLWDRYCNQTNEITTCDPYFLANNVSWVPGIPGMFSGQINGLFQDIKIYISGF